LPEWRGKTISNSNSILSLVWGKAATLPMIDFKYSHNTLNLHAKKYFQKYFTRTDTRNFAGLWERCSELEANEESRLQE
jgi:hypothetical protein